MIGRSTRLFFDASCLIAAAGSPSGGSGFLLSLCEAGYLQGAVSDLVVVEAERHIMVDLGPAAVERYDRLRSGGFLQLLPVPSVDDLQDYRGRVNDKDLHVVASAVASGAAFLVTLDRPLLRQVNALGVGLTALLPGDFIKGGLPAHEDFPSVRPQ